ncbi:MAG: hypothetical protein WC856_02190 [Methylococcaceae bacterium]|jgi:hypothetical protein
MMCNGDKLLGELKSRQVKPEPLRCTVNNSCWCMGMDTKLMHESDVCISPAQILEQCGYHLPQKDVVYLNTLVGREFVNE